MRSARHPRHADLRVSDRRRLLALCDVSLAGELGRTPARYRAALGAVPLVASLYCAALGWLVADVVSRLLRLPAYVERRRAIVLSSLVWVPIAIFGLYQFLDYKGVMANETQCPGHMYVLQAHCGDLSDFRETDEVFVYFQNNF